MFHLVKTIVGAYYAIVLVPYKRPCASRTHDTVQYNVPYRLYAALFVPAVYGLFSATPTTSVSFLERSVVSKYGIFYLQEAVNSLPVCPGPPTIKKLLGQEKLKCSRVGIHKFLKTYHAMASIGRRVGSGRPSKITAEVKRN